VNAEAMKQFLSTLHGIWGSQSGGCKEYLPTCSHSGFFFGPENEGDMFLRNNGLISLEIVLFILHTTLRGSFLYEIYALKFITYFNFKKFWSWPQSLNLWISYDGSSCVKQP
jgi:hypothetical protein